MEWGIVSYIIRYYFNPCGTGPHLYSANTNTLRSVHRNKDLLALVGTHIFVVALPSPFVPLLYHTLRGLSRGFLNFFCSVGRFCFTSPNYALGRGCSLLSASFVPLLYHNLGGLSRGFLKFLLRKLRAGRLGHTQPLPTVRHLAWVSQLPEVFPPLDTNSIPHPSPDCNRQNVQNRDFYFLDICATFLLTKCWRYVIMEIPAPTTEGAAPKN